MASFKCSDIGMQCGFEVKTNTEAELMPLIAFHAKESHGIEQIPEELLIKVKGAIRS